MNVHDTGSTPDLNSPAIPRPRPAGRYAVVGTRPAAGAVATNASARRPSPWPEPSRLALGGRPRTEYWDVTSASWRPRGLVPREVA